MIISDSGAAAAINMAGGTVIMNDGTKLTNHKRTSGYGPAVYMTGGNFKMKGGTISGCESRNYGGAIYLDGGSFEMNGGIIENNKTPLIKSIAIFLYFNFSFLLKGLFLCSKGDKK